MKNLFAAELRSLFAKAGWSVDGWRAAWATEKSLRQWAVVNLANVVLAFAIPMTAGERALLLSLGILVLAAELMNTALEEMVDWLSPDHDPRAKRAKDCGSAAVALTAIAGGVAWAVILFG
jgi:diacylglycerol kinase (ATP)